jgi:hypothetical protein
MGMRWGLCKAKNYLKVTKSMMDKKNTQDKNQLKINRGRFDSLNIFEVTEAELEIIEKGSPNSIYLNFAIFLLTIASQSLITLLTVKVQSMTVLSIFAISCGVGVVLGSLLLALWYRHRSDFTKVIKKVKDRLKTE